MNQLPTPAPGNVPVSLPEPPAALPGSIWPPAPVLTGTGTPSPAPRRPGRTRTVTGFFAIALLSATLASGGTFLVLKSSGALDVGTSVDSTLAEAPAGAPLVAPANVPENAPANAPAVDPSPSTGIGPAQAAPDSGSVVVDVAARVSPAVVTIIQSGGSASGNPSNPFGNATGVGSGVVFDGGGWILTNRHVVEGASSLTVRLSDGRIFPARVYGTDTLTDLAIVKVEATGLPSAELGDSASLKIGQLAIAIGNPLAEYTNSVTTGVVSGLNRSIELSTGGLDDLIQTDAAINPGNSGGPLLDASGKGIGINTAEAGSAQGIGFAIPIDLALPLTRQALAGKALSRPWLGIRYRALDAGVAQANKLDVNQGAWISAGQGGGGQSAPAVEPGSPAARAGLKENDVITAIDGAAVDGTHPLVELLARHNAGDTITLAVLRGSESLHLQVTLTERPASTQ